MAMIKYKKSGITVELPSQTDFKVTPVLKDGRVLCNFVQPYPKGRELTVDFWNIQIMQDKDGFLIGKVEMYNGKKLVERQILAIHS